MTGLFVNKLRVTEILGDFSARQCSIRSRIIVSKIHQNSSNRIQFKKSRVTPLHPLQMGGWVRCGGTRFGGTGRPPPPPPHGWTQSVVILLYVMLCTNIGSIEHVHNSFKTKKFNSIENNSFSFSAAINCCLLCCKLHKKQP
jgi:hypothetical protein